MQERVYGVSYKFEFGRWKYWVWRFKTEDAARKWLHTEECDFRERQICTKEEAIELCGNHEWVETAEYYDCYD